jgi:fatty-acid desaturase
MRGHEGSERVQKNLADWRHEDAAVELASNVSPPWEWPWWRTRWHDAAVFFWISLIHATAFIGLVLFPLPGWRIVLVALGMAWLGGVGTTVCYHRALAHRAVKLNGVTGAILTILALANGSGAPVQWVASHRFHHANVDTEKDISSPRHGFFWAHLRWLWQSNELTPIARFCAEFDRPSYRIWDYLQVPILALSYFGGLHWGWAAFFWLGSIRLVFALHAQCFVNSVCHTEPEVAPGEDSSRNVRWLGLMQLFLGENWHRNHHARAGSARLGWTWRQPDLGYWLICVLERLGAATDVRHLRALRRPDSELS